MLLNSEGIQAFITSAKKGVKQQVGVDLTIKNIKEIKGGEIFKEKATIFPYLNLEKTSIEGSDHWNLEAGKVYSLEFNEGIKLDNNHAGLIIHRSSVLRAGCVITSGMYDSGFQCDTMGATLFCHIDTLIEEGARLAQLVIFENYETVPYDGNYQGSKDLK